MSSALDQYDTPEEALEAILQEQADIVRRLQALESATRAQDDQAESDGQPTFWSEPELDFT